MPRLRPLIGLIVILWAAMLAFPMGRVNFVMQEFHSGLTPMDQESYPWLYPYHLNATNFGNNSCWDPGALPDADSLLESYPDDPIVNLGLVNGPTEGQIESLDQLIVTHPRDASLIAGRLVRSCDLLTIGRYDNPFANEYWPKVDTDDRPASPRSEWLTFLGLAQRGAALEPENTFFDWMRMAALFALKRDDVALAVMNTAAGKTDFDDHARDQNLAILDAYARARPLTASEQLRMGHWDFDELKLLRSVWPCVAAKVVEQRTHGRGLEAATTAYNLMRMSRVLREKSYLVEGTLDGNRLESEAITWVNYPPMGWTKRFSLFVPPGPLADSS